MRLRETGLVAARELRQATRGRWFLLAAASFFVLSLGLSLLGLAGAERSGLAGFDRTTASLLSLAVLFVPLLTLAVGAHSVAGELEDGTLAVLMAEPLTRGEVFAGKFLGLLASVWASLLAGFGLTGLTVGLLAGGGDVGAFLALVGLMLLYGAATLALSTLLSTVLRSRARALGAGFAAWLFFVYISDLGVIGLAVARSLGQAELLFLALLNPVQQARLAGMLALTDRLEVLGPVGIYALDHLGATVSAALLHGTLAVQALALAILGWWRFRKVAVI